MDIDTAKIRLKLGAIEVEYEGKANFLQDGLLNVMKEIVGFYGEHKASIPPAPPASATTGKSSAGATGLSTSTIATRLGVKKAGDLAIAAAAHLTFVQQKDKFTRDEIAAEMKAAPIFFKQTMIGNLTPTLNTLTKSDRLNQSGKDVYALSSSERTSLEPKLAQSS